MKHSAAFVGLGRKVLTVLAWVSLVLQVAAGIFVLVVGGEPVVIGGVDVPARLVGVLNCIGGVIYFFVLLLISHVLQVLLEIHQRHAAS